ncbi:MAG TPA: hypothetical protein VGC41_10775 [Kofleriaceae bacterium]
MKRLLLILLAAGACSKPNDAVALHDEAIAISHFYKPAVEDMNKRGQEIVARGGKLQISSGQAGAEVASRAISMAGQQLGELRGLVVPGPDGKSQIEKEADGLFKEGKTVELQKLIDESNEKLETGARVIAGELNLAEAWIDNVERGTTVAVAGTPPTQPSPEPAGSPGGGADSPSPARAEVPAGTQTHP